MQQTELSTMSQPVSTTQNQATVVSLEQGDACCQALVIGTSDLLQTPAGKTTFIHLMVTCCVCLIVIANLALTSSSLGGNYTPLVTLNASILSLTSLNLTGNCSYEPPVLDLTMFGVEPNPGPNVKLVMKELKKKQAKNKVSHPGSKAIVLSNASPAARAAVAPRQTLRGGQKYLDGSSFNPRADMVGYYQALSDPERYPPVRLGGETMIKTALTTLHGQYAYTPGGANSSFVFHPRIWAPLALSTTTSSPYTYLSVNGGNFYNSTATGTLQTLAESARVVSCKLKVYSTAAATADNGAITIGLCPRDDGIGLTTSYLDNFVVPNSAGANLITSTTVSSSGYPIYGTSGNNTATQGYNEFSSEDWTDTVPVKSGASVFWLPEDPQSFIFDSRRVNQSQMQQANSSGVAAGSTSNTTPILDPFFCIGLTGLTATTSTVIIEAWLNLEYTVTSGANGVIATKTGCMNSIEAFSVAKRIGGNLNSTVEPDPEASLGDKFGNLGKSILKSGVSRISDFIFGSSDVGRAINAFIA